MVVAERIGAAALAVAILASGRVRGRKEVF